MKNPDADMSLFKFKLEKMPVSGALFDMDKLSSVSRDVIAKMSEETLFDEISAWAADNDEKLNAYITASPDKFKESIKLWKYNGKKVRKDIAKWSDLSEMFPYLYGDGVDGYEFDEKLTAADRDEFINAYISAYDHSADSSAWFDGVKAVGEPLGFCPNIKEYKASPENFKGSVADACGILRVAVTGRKNSPDLYTIMQLLGEEETLKRMKAAIGK